MEEMRSGPIKMKNKFFNNDYFKSTLEETSLIRLCASRIKKVDCQNNRVLIIIPCLMGEFVALLPAIFDFQERNKSKTIDMVVSSPLKALAERISFVSNVYVAKSVAGRENEFNIKNDLSEEPYQEVIIIKASKDALNNIIPNIKAGKVKNTANLTTKYGYNLIKSAILRREPIQWRSFAFSLFASTPREVYFKDIFNFTEEEYKSYPKVEGLDEKRKKIIIHTGGSWYMQRWHLDRWAELLKKINKSGDFDLIFIGQEKEMKDYEYISSRLDFKIFSVISKINSAELLLLMNSSDYFLGIDSGPGNLAHLIGLRSLMIYGPGPHIYMPTDKNDIVISKSRGRGIYQQFFFKKKSFISKITVDEVHEAFLKLTSIPSK